MFENWKPIFVASLIEDDKSGGLETHLVSKLTMASSGSNIYAPGSSESYVLINSSPILDTPTTPGRLTDLQRVDSCA